MDSDALRTTHILDRLERAMDFPAYLMQRGYALSVRQSEWGVLMRGPSDAVNLTIDPATKKWTYELLVATDKPALRRTGESGSVCDFMMKRELLSFREATAKIGALLNVPGPARGERGEPASEHATYRKLHRDKPADLRQAVLRHELAAREQADVRRRLEHLGVRVASVDESRFRPIRREIDATTLMGANGPWRSATKDHDARLVLVERPIDALAYEQSRPHGRTSYVALGAGANSNPEILAWAKEVLMEWRREHPGSEVVLAFGHDKAGKELASRGMQLAAAVGLAPPKRESPQLGCRWSEQMQLEHRHRQTRGDRGVGLGHS